MNAESIRDLLTHEIQDLHSAESQIIEALPAMIEYAADSALRDALEQHLEVTETHRRRLEEAARELAIDAKGEKCKGIAGILKEGSDGVEDIADPAVRDAMIIAAAQRVEHYEIAGYGTVCSYASLLGEGGVLNLLKDSLDEEREADEILTEIAQSRVNQRAVAE